MVSVSWVSFEMERRGEGRREEGRRAELIRGPVEAGLVGGRGGG